MSLGAVSAKTFASVFRPPKDFLRSTNHQPPPYPQWGGSQDGVYPHPQSYAGAPLHAHAHRGHHSTYPQHHYRGHPLSRGAAGVAIINPETGETINRQQQMHQQLQQQPAPPAPQSTTSSIRAPVLSVDMTPQQRAAAAPEVPPALEVSTPPSAPKQPLRHPGVLTPPPRMKPTSEQNNQEILAQMDEANAMPTSHSFAEIDEKTLQRRGASGSSEDVDEVPDSPPVVINVSTGSRIYGFSAMKESAHTTSSVPPAVKSYVLALWSKVHGTMPKHLLEDLPSSPVMPNSPWDTMESVRDAFGSNFKGPVRSKPVREIHHKVLSVLSRITPQKYDVLKQELLDLPLRQTDDAQLAKVIEVFFEKAVQEEAFNSLYACLVADVCTTSTAQSQEGREKTIAFRMRRALLDRCQEFFEKPFQLVDTDKVDASGRPLTQDELDRKKASLKKKTCGNVKFVGELFKKKLVTDRVIVSVLCTLLFGNQQGSGYIPEDYELEMFATLLTIAAKRLSDSPNYKEFLDTFVEQAEVHSKHYPIPRVRFLMMNVLDLAKNHWVPKRETGPMSIEDLQRRAYEDQQRQSEHIEKQLKEQVHQQQLAHQRRKKAHPGPVTSPVKSNSSREKLVSSSASLSSLPSTPIKPSPLASPLTGSPSTTLSEKVSALMDRIATDKDEPNAAVAFFNSLDSATQRPQALKMWVARTITKTRCHVERDQFSRIAFALTQANIFSHKQIVDIVRQTIVSAIENGDYEDCPGLFTNFADLVTKSGGMLPANLHNVLMRELVNSCDAPDILVKALQDTYPTDGAKVSVANGYSRMSLLPHVKLFGELPPQSATDSGSFVQQSISELIDKNVRLKDCLDWALFRKVESGATAEELIAAVDSLSHATDNINATLNAARIASTMYQAELASTAHGDVVLAALKHFLGGLERTTAEKAATVAVCELIVSWRLNRDTDAKILTRLVGALVENHLLSAAQIRSAANLTGSDADPLRDSEFAQQDAALLSRLADSFSPPSESEDSGEVPSGEGSHSTPSSVA